MTIDQIKTNSSYLLYCRENYFLGIRPGDSKSKKLAEYERLKEIALLYFENNLQGEFAGYLMEGHYFVQLWTAHLILEYGTPDGELTKECLEEIQKYSESELSPDVAVQEKEWLRDYLFRNNCKRQSS